MNIFKKRKLDSTWDGTLSFSGVFIIRPGNKNSLHLENLDLVLNGNYIFEEYEGIFKVVVADKNSRTILINYDQEERTRLGEDWCDLAKIIYEPMSRKATKYKKC
jgi:hypothetical protein